MEIGEKVCVVVEFDQGKPWRMFPLSSHKLYGTQMRIAPTKVHALVGQGRMVEAIDDRATPDEIKAWLLKVECTHSQSILQGVTQWLRVRKGNHRLLLDHIHECTTQTQ